MSFSSVLLPSSVSMCLDVHEKWINFHIPGIFSLCTLLCPEPNHTQWGKLLTSSRLLSPCIVLPASTTKGTLFLQDFKCILMAFICENNTVVCREAWTHFTGRFCLLTFDRRSDALSGPGALSGIVVFLFFCTFGIILYEMPSRTMSNNVRTKGEAFNRVLLAIANTD